MGTLSVRQQHLPIGFYDFPTNNPFSAKILFRIERNGANSIYDKHENLLRSQKFTRTKTKNGPSNKDFTKEVKISCNN